MANTLGVRMLIRYAEGTATLAQLDVTLAKGWITQAEYDTATMPPTP